MKKKGFLMIFSSLFVLQSNAQVDYSVVYVNEESGTEFTRILSENDSFVCQMYIA